MITRTACIITAATWRVGNKSPNMLLLSHCMPSLEHSRKLDLVSSKPVNPQKIYIKLITKHPLEKALVYFLKHSNYLASNDPSKGL